MQIGREYRLYVNDTLVFFNTYQLGPKEQFEVTFPLEGNSIRLEADQDPNYPSHSFPRQIVNDCNNSNIDTAIFNLVVSGLLDNMDTEKSSACNFIVDSYDPNDKLAIPVGKGANFQILPNQELEYTIRFQNTGTDTAYTVRIVDTLDIDLDISSFSKTFEGFERCLLR